jgi:tetratricopeptide (TPR) repeat protein
MNPPRNGELRDWPTARAPLMAALSAALWFSAARASATEPAEELSAALAHLDRGRYAESAEELEKLVQAGTHTVEAALALSRCHEELGEWDQARAVMAELLRRHEDEPRAWARQAQLLFLSANFEECQAALNRALAIDEEQPLARLVQTELLAATGQYEKADDASLWFVRYYNRKQPSDAATLLVVARGVMLYGRWHPKSGNLEMIINTLCPDALKNNPNCWQAHALAAGLLLEKFNRAQGLPELRKALAINAHAAEALALQAAASMAEREHAEARKFLDRALEVNPKLPHALLLDADLRLEAGDLAGARRALAQARSISPADERVLGRVAAIDLLEDGPPPAAELDALFHNVDAIAEAEIQNPSRFSRTFMEAARRSPRPGVFLETLGTELESRRKFELAERAYRKAMQLVPRMPGPRTALGMLCMRVGKLEEAQAILDEAFEADPYHVRVSNMRKVAKLLDGYQTINTDHFIIRVDTQADKILGRYMAEFLEEQYPVLVEQFGYAPQSRTQFEIFHRAKGLSAHQWFSARMVGLPWIQTIGASTGMIVALASPTATDRKFNWAKVLKHEFVHIITLQGTNFNIPHWFTEALAMLAEGYPAPESWNHMLRERAARNQLMNLENINEGFIHPKSPDDWQMAYCQSRLYAEYMLERFGNDATARLLAAYRENLPASEAITKAFGVGKSEFEAGYRQHLEKLLARLEGLWHEDPPKPLSELEKAHRREPDDAGAASRYAAALLKVNRRKEARKLAEQVLEKNPTMPIAAVVMARLALRAEDLPGAVRVLEPALDNSNPHPEVLTLLAELKLAQNNLDEAAALYEAGLARAPAHIPWLKGLATAHLKGRKMAALRPVLERLIAVDPDDPMPRRKLAEMALAEGNHADAVRFGRMALEIDVLDLAVHRTLAQAYEGLGNLPKAIEEWDVASQIAPDNAEVITALAKALSANGQQEAALLRLEAFLEQQPNAGAARKLREQLK